VREEGHLEREKWQWWENEFCFPENIDYNESEFKKSIVYIINNLTILPDFLSYNSQSQFFIKNSLNNGFSIRLVALDKNRKQTSLDSARYYKLFFKVESLCFDVLSLYYDTHSAQVSGITEHIEDSRFYVSYFCNFLMEAHSDVKNAVNRFEKDAFYAFIDEKRCVNKE
jgi:hypothetical protein